MASCNEVFKTAKIVHDSLCSVFVSPQNPKIILSLPFESDDLYLHHDRIRRDIRHLAVRIASTIESPEQWTEFCNENGGFEPLFECIQESAFSMNFNSYDLADYTRSTTDFTKTNNKQHYFESYMKQNKGIMEKEEIYTASCTACKALRDLCALSPDVAAVVTDNFIKFDQQMELKNERTLFCDLVILLKYNSDYEKTYQRISALVPLDKGGSLNMLRRRGKSVSPLSFPFVFPCFV